MDYMTKFWHAVKPCTIVGRILACLGSGLLLLLLSTAASAQQLDTIVSGNGSVEIFVNGASGAVCPGNCNYTYAGQGPVDTIELFPVADPGFELVSWGGVCQGVPVSSFCTVFIGPNSNLLSEAFANFAPSPVRSLNVIIAGTGTGSVTDSLGNPPIDCPGDCSVTYNQTSTTTLFAQPGPGAQFTGWQGEGCSGTGSCTVTVDGIKNVVATFDIDADSDGVLPPLDQCPNTPIGEMVNSDGCSTSQLDDDDGDGVNNVNDQCPNTPASDTVDAQGCSVSVDDDNDGVINAIDDCPNTPINTDVDDLGCSVTQQFGDELANLSGLNSNQRQLATRIDEICPLLQVTADESALTQGQRDLRTACANLKNRGTSADQATSALNQITLLQLSALQNYVRDIVGTQRRYLGYRQRQLNAGGGGGISVSGLNLRSGDQAVSGQVLNAALQQMLGMGASEDSFADFGKLGLYVQGDIDFGERDTTALESGYDFDSWNLTVGTDYRFTDNFYGGLALSLGEAEIEYSANSGDTSISNWGLATYMGWQISDNWYVDGLISYGESEFESKRRVNYVDIAGNFDVNQLGDTDGKQLFLGFNTGYMFNNQSWRFGPIASLTYLDGSIDGFVERSEQGQSQAWNFQVDKQNFESLRFSAGAQVDYIINTSFGVLMPGLRASYVYEAEDGADYIALRLANNPFADTELNSNPMVLQTNGRDNSFIDVSLNLSAQFVMGVSGYFSYQFLTAYDDYSQAGYSIGLRWDKSF